MSTKLTLTQKCEDFLVSRVKTKAGYDVLAELIVAQKYELKTLAKICIREARRLSLFELKYHTESREIEPGNYIQITEGIIARLENEKVKEKDDNNTKGKAIKRRFKMVLP